MHRFQVGDRVRLSKLGEQRSPRMSMKVGTIVSQTSHKSGSASVLIQFDDRKEPCRLHWSHVELIGGSAKGDCE
jgi:hypothetical protein